MSVYLPGFLRPEQEGALRLHSLGRPGGHLWPYVDSASLLSWDFIDFLYKPRNISLFSSLLCFHIYCEYSVSSGKIQPDLERFPNLLWIRQIPQNEFVHFYPPDPIKWTTKKIEGRKPTPFSPLKGRKETFWSIFTDLLQAVRSIPAVRQQRVHPWEEWR